MLSCVRCGQCLTSCPTYVLSGREAEGPRGRVALARAVHDGVLPLTADLLRHESNCLICDACTAVCPAGVHMDPLQVAFRSAVESHVKRGGKERLIRKVVFKHLFTNMTLFRLLVLGLWLYQRLGIQKLTRAIGIVKLLGMEQAEAFLPKVSRPFLVPKGEVYPAERPHPQPPPRCGGEGERPICVPPLHRNGEGGRGWGYPGCNARLLLRRLRHVDGDGRPGPRDHPRPAALRL